MKLILLSFFLFSLSFGYTDMTNVSARAAELNMTTNDYSFAMSIAGIMSGYIFGLFLWKVK